MAMRLDYLARETGQNLRRNPMLTVASILTVTVSLGMLAVVMLMGYGISNAFEKWNNDVTFIVYLNPEATPDQVESLGKELRENPQIAGVTYLDKAASFAEFKRLFPDQPSLTENVTPEVLPTSFRVKPRNPDATAVRSLANSFASRPGVYKVEFVAEAVKLVQQVASKLRRFALAGAVALLVASLLLIVNTIQTAVFSRRREIEVMKLVGATNWFIRMPFILEGLIQGLAGSALASLLAWFFEARWFASFTGLTVQTVFDTMRWTGGQFSFTVLLVFIIGALVGAVGSAASVTWYLRE
jgi:cell division transport system permease protein